MCSMQVNIPKVLCIHFRWIPEFLCMPLLSFFLFLLSYWINLKNSYHDHLQINFTKLTMCRKTLQLMPSTLKHFWGSALIFQGLFSSYLSYNILILSLTFFSFLFKAARIILLWCCFNELLKRTQKWRF